MGITALSIISALRFQLASGSLRLVLSPAVGHPVAGASSRRCALRGEAAWCIGNNFSIITIR